MYHTAYYFWSRGLDEDAEKTLARLRKARGLSISEVLKRGLQAYDQLVQRQGEVRPYEIYRRITLGKGGWSAGPAGDAKRAVRAVIRRKHGR